MVLFDEETSGLGVFPAHHRPTPAASDVAAGAAMGGGAVAAEKEQEQEPPPLAQPTLAAPAAAATAKATETAAAAAVVEPPTEMPPMGFELSVLDLRDNRWYDAKVIKLHAPDDKFPTGRIRIHFKGWSKAQDEWIELSSDRLAKLPSKYRPKIAAATEPTAAPAAPPLPQLGTIALSLIHI